LQGKENILIPRKFCTFAFLLCAAALPSLAQETINNATVGGRVTDPSGAVVTGAKVTARQVDTNLATTTETDREGLFRFPYLRLGAFEVTVNKDGFAPATRTVTLTVGSAFDLPIALTVASGRTVDTVTAEGAVLETARSQIAGTVSQSEIADLPLNGRNFLDLALLVPGVSPTNTASNQLFAETAAVPGQGISVGSQRNFSNSFIVDGLSNNDDAAGLTNAYFGLDVVQEFQVVTSGGQAEFGRALGGYVNMVTNSGTNALHADLYGYLRNQRFNAANPLINQVLPLTQLQTGASVGGPIKRDRTFYFANFELRQQNQSGLITISPANVAAINARLLAAGYQGSLISTGIYPNPIHMRNFLGKVDHQFSMRDQASFRYSLYDVDSNNSRGAGALSAVSAAAGLNDADNTIAASNVAILSPRTVNESRGQFTYSGLQAPVNDPLGPAVSISGVASFGTLSGSPTGRLTKSLELADSLAHRVGAHSIRTGVDFLYNDTTITYPRSIRGSYSFSSLANFLSGTYNSSGFSQTFGNSVINQTNPNVGFYAQDEWKVTPRFTMNFGARYDLQFLQTISTQPHNISPRGGFAWAPLASRKTVVRGSFGLFYDRVPLRALANALLSSGNTTTITSTSQASVSLSPTQLGAPVFPNIITALPAGLLFNLTTMDPNMKNAYSEQGGFEIEQQVGARATFSAAYEHIRGRHLIISVNQNVPTCAAAGTNNGCRPNPNFANNSQYSPRADSQYDGLHLSFVQKPVRWGSYRVSYTYSKALDDVGEFFFSGPLDVNNLRGDWARSDDDQRHRLVIDGSAHTPTTKADTAWKRITYGFQLSGSLQNYSTLPFNITTGSNTIQGTAARPTVGGVFIGRNLGTGFDFFNLNTRLSRNFALTERLHLQAVAEAFNLFNHRNNMVPNGTFGAGAYPAAPSATFGTPTAVGDSRTLQFALRFTL
jgi:Carboxypeptidase regulatory-like domain/TonB dependent receptor